MIVLDTATLITNSQLQSDCDDLRLTDSDGSTLISYWVEAGCNTTTTQIWARVPSLPGGGKTIYVYYGNSSINYTLEASWTGKFILFSDAACPTGWDSNTDFYDKFTLGGSTYGTSGGSNSHTHSDISCTSGIGCEDNYHPTGGSGAEVSGRRHNHTFAVSVNSGDNVPQYFDVLFCESKNLIVSTNFISMFEALPGSGWTAISSSLNGYFPRGNTSYSGTGTGSNTHNHTTNSASSSLNGTFTFQGGGQSIWGAHRHTISATTTSSIDHTPPYWTMIFAKPDSETKALAGATVMASVLPPLGWERFTDLDDRFPLASASANISGGSTTHTAHTATLSSGGVSTSPNTEVDSDTPGSVTRCYSSHNHSCTATSTEGNSLPVYTTVLYIQRKTSQSTSTGDAQQQESPTLLYTEGQTNPVGVTDFTPEFSAVFNGLAPSDTGVYYQIEVNTAADFTGTYLWDSTKTAITAITDGARSADISYAGTVLSYNSPTYYWRIKFWDQNDLDSLWSSVANFTMDTSPTSPTLLYTEGQADPISVTDLTPEFSAIFNDPDPSDTGVYYQIEVNTAADFTGTSMWDSTKTAITAVTNGARSGDISYAGTALSYNGATYYWRIKFWDQVDNEGSWSSPGLFILSGKPHLPSLNYPHDGQAQISTLPTLKTTATDPNSDYLRYKIELCTDLAMTLNCQAFDQTSSQTGWNHQDTQSNTAYLSGTEAAYTLITPLAFNTTYYWRSYAIDPGGLNTWSDTQNPPFSFTVHEISHLYIENIKLDGIQLK